MPMLPAAGGAAAVYMSQLKHVWPRGVMSCNCEEAYVVLQAYRGDRCSQLPFKHAPKDAEIGTLILVPDN